MNSAAVDVPAIVLALGIAAIITVVLMVAHRGDNHRRGWIAAGALAAALAAIGLLDLMRASPRETPLLTAVFAAVLPVLCSLGMIRGTRGVRPWIRWLLVFITALAFLFGGLLIGATLMSRLFPI